MTTITTNNSSSVMNISELMNLLGDLAEPLNDSESMFYEVDAKCTQENIHEDYTHHNHVQSPTERTTSSLHTLAAKVKKIKKQPSHKKSSELKQKMKDDINQLRQKTKKSLAKIQTSYARLNVDLQNVEKIYSSVPLFYPSIQEAPELKTAYSLNNSPHAWKIPPESKKEMADGIDRLMKKHLEKIQIHYAHELKVDLQDIKNIYSAVSNKEQSANKSSIIETRP